MLSIQNLSFRHESEIFSGLNLEISRGDFIRICGPNGCGKTSLLRLLAGLIPSIYPGSYKGKILYEGTELTPEHVIPGIALTGPWAASRLFCRTVREEICFSPSADAQEAERLIHYFGLEDLCSSHPQNLSGGQQQLVLLCAYLSCRPGLLLLDECFAQLSESMTELLVKLLKQKHDEGATIIMVEHKIPLSLKSHVKTVSLKQSSGAEVPGKSTEQKISEAVVLSGPLQTEPYFQTRNLVIKPGGATRLSYKDIALHKGMILHAHGPIGSGKSTLIRSLLSLGQYEGDIVYAGKTIRKMKRKTMTSMISAVLQSPDSQFFCTTVREEISYTAKRKGLNASNYTESICRDLGLSHCLDRSPFTLSQGEKKKCQIASALAHDPVILLLDEPDAGLDQESTNQLEDLFVKLLNQNKIILFTSHNTSFVDSLRQRIPHLRQYLMKENVREV